MDLRKYSVDLDAESNGVWVEMDGASLLIARMYNPKFNKRMQELTALYRAGNSTDVSSVPEERAIAILNAALADAVLLGWTGMIGLDGNDLSYSRQAALDLLSNPKLHDIKERIVQIAQDQARYRDKEIETTLGKSEATSPGT